jgi:hypothetical protein
LGVDSPDEVSIVEALMMFLFDVVGSDEAIVFHKLCNLHSLAWFA